MLLVDSTPGGFYWSRLVGYPPPMNPWEVLFGLLGLRIPEPELRKLEFMVVLLISDCRYCC